MKRIRYKLQRISAFLLLLLILISPVWSYISLHAIEGISCVPRENGKVIAKVIRVIDGDTIEVLIKGFEYRIRYIGMDSPESGDIDGHLATNYNKSLVENKYVTLIKDVSETDRYGRLLRYVIVDNTFVNYQMVKNGWATSESWPPDTFCDQNILSAEIYSQMNYLGVWKDENSSTFGDNFSNTPLSGNLNSISDNENINPNNQCPNGCSTSSDNCMIKGNINSKGEKIYHTPEDRSYDQTVLTPRNGERWFCTEEEAIKNGWRKPKS